MLGSSTSPSTASSNLSDESCRRYSTGSISSKCTTSVNGDSLLTAKHAESINGDLQTIKDEEDAQVDPPAKNHTYSVNGDLLRSSCLDDMNGVGSGSGHTESARDDHLPSITSRASIDSDNASKYAHKEHVIQLSSIEHCMARAYIRVCLAYRLPDDMNMDDLVHKLNQFTRRVIDAKPYLAGHVVPAPPSPSQPSLVEIRFTDHDFLNYPSVRLEHISVGDIPYDYQELDQMKLPPSLIRPDIVSALPEGTNDGRAPVFRLQANVVKGGLIVSTYLHHCISDGTGMGLIITGSVLHDDFTFDRHLESRGFDTSGLNQRLSEFANQQSIVRKELSWSFPNQIRDRHFHHHRPLSSHNSRPKPTGRGCIFGFRKDKMIEFRQQLQTIAGKNFITINDALRKLC